MTCKQGPADHIDAAGSFINQSHRKVKFENNGLPLNVHVPSIVSHGYHV
ncbi:hypothetical protein [Planomicrobium soli]|nr:hypothetical protein [Planomicrobium soli]